MKHALAASRPLVILLTLSLSACGGHSSRRIPVPEFQLRSMLKDINSSGVTENDSAPGEFVKVGSVTFFRAATAEHGQELWKTDGTEGATVLVKDIEPGSFGSYPSRMVAVGSVLFFVATSDQSTLR